MNQLVAFLAIHEIGQTLSPCILELDEYLDKFYVIFELWINHFNVLLVLFQ